MTSVPILSSMATRRILADLVGDWERATGNAATLVSIGGVEAIRRIRTGEVFDVVLLSKEALRELASDGLVEAGSITDFAISAAAIAIPSSATPTGDVKPDGAAAIKRLIAASGRVAVSTGPSGKAARALLQTWGFVEPSCHIVEAAPGIPVARLLAAGEADVGFQQLSELIGEPGIEILGPVPGDVLPATVFSAAHCHPHEQRTRAAEDLLRHLTSSASDAAKVAHGMAPPSPGRV